jgi:hypothetical protein
VSRRAWTLLVAIVVLGGLVGGVLWLNRPRPVSAAVAPAKIALSTGAKDSLEKIVLSGRAMGTLTLVKKAKAWTLEPRAPAGVTFDTGAIDDLAASFTELYAETLIDEKPADLSEYGLKPPKATAVGTFSDASAHTLLLGDKTPTGGAFYLQVKGDPKVYTVGAYIGERLLWTANDLRSRAIEPSINYEEVASLKVARSDGTVIEVRAKTAEEAKSFQLGFGKYLMTRPFAYPRGLDAEKQDPLIKGLQGLRISTFVDDEPKDLARYGLARPWGEAIVRDKANTLDVLFGAKKDAGQTYFMIRGQPSVYSTDTASVAFMDTRPFDVVDKFTFIPNIEDVDAISITAGGKAYALVITRTAKKAEKAGAPDEVSAAYAVDGKSAPEDNFKKFYQALIGLQIEGEVKRQVPDAPVVSVRYTLNKGPTRTVTLEFAPYDRDFHAIFMNGVSAFALTRGQVDRMLVKLEMLAKGQPLQE